MASMLVDILQSFAILCLALALIIHVRKPTFRFTRDDLLSAERVQRLFNSRSLDPFDRGK